MALWKLKKVCIRPSDVLKATANMHIERKTRRGLVVQQANIVKARVIYLVGIRWCIDNSVESCAFHIALKVQTWKACQFQN